MDFINIRFLNKKQKTGIKPLKICMLMVAILIFASAFGFTQDSEEGTIERTGTIDGIGDNEIVVDDCHFKLSPGVKFYTNSKMNTYANRSRFKKGNKVGFQFYNNGVVTVMWLESK